MYTIVYYYREQVGESVVEREYHGEDYRLRINALIHVMKDIQSDYREDGYGTEPIVGGIKCYKSEKTEKGDRKIIEVRIKVEKVG